VRADLETPIQPLHADHFLRSLVASPDGQHFAYAVRAPDGIRIIRDGSPGPVFDAVWFANYGSDSRHFAYLAKRGEDFFMVFDETQSGPYGTTGRPVFRPDGGAIAYYTRRADGDHVVVAGQEGLAYPRIASDPVFSPDGKRLAFAVVDDAGPFVVVDGEPAPHQSHIFHFEFSPDSEVLAMLVEAPDGRQRYVLGDRQLAAHKRVDSLRFSPGSDHFVYVARKGARVFAVRDEAMEAEGFEDIPLAAIQFSPDGSDLLYVGVTDAIHEKRTVVLNGAPLKTHGRLQAHPSFTPDGCHIVYLTNFAGASRIFVDEQVVGSYAYFVQPALTLRFTSASRFSVLAARDDRQFVIVDVEIRGDPC
jgi:hypothetical protein